MNDPVECVIDGMQHSLRLAFSNDSSQPPVGLGTDTVRFVAGDALPMAMWDAHTDSGQDCDRPLVWVRLSRRYRTQAFPAQVVSSDSCSKPVVAVVEAGIARCAVTDVEPSWEQYEREAEVSLDDSWRLERALCHAAESLRSSGCATNAGVDNLVPYGPEGGVIAWMGELYVQL